MCLGRLVVNLDYLHSRVVSLALKPHWSSTDLASLSRQTLIRRTMRKYFTI